MAESKVRPACVAGQFYNSSSTGLKNQIEGLIDKNAAKSDCLACILPHAGYTYSGRVAAETVSRINIKEKIILLGPNHTGVGRPFSIMAEGAWLTPSGKIDIDSSLAKSLLNACAYLDDDPSAHEGEHSLEVELPFLQYFKENFKIVPLTILSDDLFTLKKIGADIAKVIEELGIKNSVMVVASSDMTHYEPQKQAEEKDNQAIQAIIELDEDKLMQKVKKLDISMCGYAPVVIMLSYAKKLGAKKAKLISYQTSGDVTGDRTSVVGYAGLIIQ